MISGNGGVIPTNLGTIPGNDAIIPWNDGIIGFAMRFLAELNATRWLPRRLRASALNRGWECEALSNPLLPERSRGWRRGQRVRRGNCRPIRLLSALWASEIGEVGADWMLSPPVTSFHLMRPQQLP